MIKIFPGPFTSPRTAVINHLPQRSIINAKDRPLEDRIALLARAKDTLTSCGNISELMRMIDELAKKYLNPVGKLVYLAFIGSQQELTAFTYPEEIAPPPTGFAPTRSAPSLFASRNQTPTYPIKLDLISAAVYTKDIHREESEKKEYLAIPLVSPDRSKVLGVLLLVNHFSNESEKITTDDIKVTRAFAEIASEEVFRLIPPTPPTKFVKLSYNN